jgi:OmpA-OmpF porin, OOP family
MRCLLLAAAAASLLCVAATAQAQGNPSSDQIIRSLTPSGTMGTGTRGVRPVSPGAAPAAGAASPAAPVSGAPAVAAQSAPAVSLTVQFETGSATLTPQATRTLDQLGMALTSANLASYRFRIEGHTDTVGKPEMNQALSERRAAAVASYLQSKFSIAAARLETVGMGEAGLLVPTPPQTAEPRNRRVQVVNLGT